MKISAVVVDKIDSNHPHNIYTILKNNIKSLEDHSIVVITSKIISICQRRVVKIGTIDKLKLIHKEAKYYLPSNNKYHISLTVTNNLLVPTAGIDESNGNGYYILWPKNVQKSANEIREFLVQHFSKKDIGVIISDSKTTPLRWGTTGVCIAHSGFLALNNYIGKKDLFGRELEVTKANISDALAASAVVVMGEGNEQTPLAIIEDIPFVHFQKRNPSQKELDGLKISLKDDLYSSLLTSVQWKKGESK